MIIESSFRAPWWLSNPHSQTLYPFLMRSIKAPVDKTERLELADGDFIDLFWAINGLRADTPLVLLLHGLGGSIHSKYVAGFMQAFNEHGWRVVLMHFRGASEEPNRLLRAYHSGETSDLSEVLSLLSQREPKTAKAVVGVSLGGNVLLKWLGEHSKQKFIHAAVAVSVPFQLVKVANRMGYGFARIYQAYLLKSIRSVFERKRLLYKDHVPEPLQNLNKWHCFWTFDDKVTAPLHGFKHAHQYYREASSLPYLCQISTPTLIIHSLDDPFMTPDVVPKEDEISKDVLFELSQKGGHVGFIGSNHSGTPFYWLDQRIPEFLADFF
ncbi:hydrolase [Legionella israelensis]|uniref:Alpha/beta hydrolase n=1 Tax=Legionella israelensis TaxID=454 RepID=A0A0W0WNI2_9GAMM|nr:hydrolase [Legionella israelensis]KTD33888.1 alpha/beta hydrolase [Legionella israelensis]QBS08945.1 hydrolase [Legionella israelensis]SCX81956.1 hypothetical protein SAMN02746069_00326 [Legionella israelensis DSM 19235]STX58637.1 hydrolase of the alpha/beta-hydrolase fold family [Legionella israelensis]